ncbi:tRNA (N6-threonylcarbamoyladenosine(37)-N6)-methyltransferase TrmO [Rhabdochromatium marinum]|uniref:tRNA (N6-threonylcarbamoyladenosine(37)-N6)-methyltransferase TrmO n=1 Tax=Rhabdochromatium marinum TaxID=48729 RepID=UPI001902DF51|nr:tRNA (N6-threonylcarbamoyladenosine(37)-N6)-methyltransferase TrmO [Rhabdochromatium marinum]MBK1647357.1 tRNA (N6-threonylcarbamoyladenosine(37)-N6)-methyltransferase TrmO [Rhabdochromatium marinum]
MAPTNTHTGSQSHAVASIPEPAATDPRDSDFQFRPIGYIRSPFDDKFGIPRQARLAPAAQARLELLPPYDRDEACSGLEGFSHLWLLFVFHQDCLTAGWQPMVRPPRLGGRAKVGVFASRAPYRPNPIGLSAVEYHGRVRERSGLVLHLGGVDLLDGTPVLDIKPYVPYADAVPEASQGFAQAPQEARWPVRFSPQAQRELSQADPENRLQLQALIEQIIGLDPRPGYMDRYPERNVFAMRLHGCDIQWKIATGHALVTRIIAGTQQRPSGYTRV